MINNPRWAVAGLVPALVGLWGCRSEDRAVGARQGIVEYDERQLSFEVGGRVLGVQVDRGDRVRAGEVLAKLDDTLELTARNAKQKAAEAAEAELSLLRAGSRKEDVRSMAAEVRAARASEDLLKKDLDREQGLLKNGVSTQAVVDDLESRVHAATAQRQSLEQRLSALAKGARPQQIEAAEANLEAAQQAVQLENERLARHELRALHGGSVTDVVVKPGEVVAPGSPVLSVADLHHPYVDVFVPETDIAGVHVGQPAVVRVDSPRQPLRGRVEYVAHSTEFTPRFLFSPRERPNLVLRVRVRVQDPREQLHSGLPAFVTLGP